MATTNRTSYAILGLLAEGPKSGYDIKQIVEKTISHFWKESYGHIYPTLSRLAAEGLISRDAAARQHRTERQRYTITAAGRAVLAAWLAAPVEPDGVRNELALKLYFGPHAPPSTSRALLEAHRQQQRSLAERYAAERPQLEARAVVEPAAVYELITLSLGERIAAARIAWCDEALRLLDSHGEPARSEGELR